VGVAFGYGTRFPARYQRALYVCDWTFGTMYAIHLEPETSSYRGVKEEFISRTPLPLTDLVVGADGAIYFAVGGRNSHSELYRIVYEGPEPTDPVDARNTAGAEQRQQRRDLEDLHRRSDEPSAAVARALPDLASRDRFIRYAARIALEHQPIECWQAAALAATDPRAAIEAAIAVARQGEPSAQPAVLAALDRVDLAALDVAGTIDLARAYQLALIRLGDPPAEARARIAARLRPRFPSGSFELDRELSSLLVALRAPGIVPTLVGMLVAPSGSAADTNIAADEEALQQLIRRNAGYGSSVRAALEKRADLLQVHYASVLRTATDKAAWTADDRRAYHDWFTRARQWAGGSSFRKFLDVIELESLAGYSENEKLAMEALGIKKPYVPPPLPKPEGPGRTWTVASVVAAAERGGNDGIAAGRDFSRGRRSFHAARCIVCHRFGDAGGATGPDLTQAAGRFGLQDLAEAIVEPSKAVSDQYRASTVLTADGRAVTGRIIGESAQTITVVTDPEQPTTFVEIARSDVEELVPAAESPMPGGLLDTLGESEVLDLLAYVLSRNNPRDQRFTPSSPAQRP